MTAQRLTTIACVLLAVAVPDPALAAGPIRALSQTADGLVFHYGVVPAGVVRTYPAGRAERNMHRTSSSGRHIVLALFDASTGERVAAAQVIAAVTPLGGATTRKRLEPMTVGGVASFGNYFALTGPDTYRIAFEVERSGHTLTQAEFEYRIPAR
jgi:hypothetical protein